MYKEAKLQQLQTLLGDKLRLAVSQNPKNYVYPASQAPMIAEKWIKTISRDGIQAISLSGVAINAVCKELGLKKTYKVLDAWLKE